MRRNSGGQIRRVALLREFEGSGLSMAELCRRRGVGFSTRAAWRRAWSSGPEATFVEVEPLQVDGGHGAQLQPRPAACARS